MHTNIVQNNNSYIFHPYLKVNIVYKATKFSSDILKDGWSTSISTNIAAVIRYMLLYPFESL
jgi:hypothetical protein